MFKNKNKILIILGILILANIVFVFAQSSMPKSDSKGESGLILQLVTPFFEIFLGQGNVTSHLIRKIAHFVEFFSLGFLSTLFYLVKNNKLSLHIIIVPIFCVCIASIDETIQIFSKRGPGLSDVFLDACGSLVALIFITIVFCFMKHRIKKSAVTM